MRVKPLVRLELSKIGTEGNEPLGEKSNGCGSEVESIDLPGSGSRITIGEDPKILLLLWPRLVAQEPVLFLWEQREVAESNGLDSRGRFGLRSCRRRSGEFAALCVRQSMPLRTSRR